MSIFKLFKSLREYKKEAILTPILMVVEVAMEVMLPLIISWFGTCIQSGDINGMVKYGLLMILVAVISLFAGMFAG